jgi:ATP-grasp ribosomal peptide maturase
MIATTVLVLTGADDPTADVVVGEIIRRGVPVERHDLGDFPARMRFTASHEQDSWSGRITGPNSTIELDDIFSIYYRRPSRFTFPPEMSNADRSYAEAEARLGLGGVLAALERRWVNHPHESTRAEWKPLQLEIARLCDLTTPRTLISNEASEAIEFGELIDGPIVCKTLSSIVLAEDRKHKITYTTPIDSRTIDAQQFAATAHLIQEWIPKAREARVTVVGSRVLAIAIEADSSRAYTDWRSDYNSIRYLPVQVPAEIESGMLRYLRTLGLMYGAFDFVITPSDEWIMLECNPSGQWLWLHHLADLPIPAALADLLTGELDT